MPSTTLFVDPRAGALALAPLTLAHALTDSVSGVGIEPLSGASAASPCRLRDQATETDDFTEVVLSLARLGKQVTARPSTSGEAHEIERLVKLCYHDLASTQDYKAATATLDLLDQRLTFRTCLVGYEPGAADWTMLAAVRANAVAAGVLKKGGHPHLTRALAFLSSQPVYKSAQADLAQRGKVKSASTANASFELGLEHAEDGKVVTRFPPEPSGYLHIGHAKAAILNQHFARQYHGKFIVRFDDTNPSKEKAEFEASILEDLTLMGIVGDSVTYTSDSFDAIFAQVMRLVDSGQAYADDTLQEQMRHERMHGLPSKHRDMPPAEVRARFEEMVAGTAEGTRWCLRAKISADDPNKALRDPVIYRCNLQPHHRTGTKWKVYPTYDFACPVVDSIEGVTHALRTNEYRDRNPQYAWMLNALGLRVVHIWDFGRVNFVYTLLSKRKLKAMVEDKALVRGWDDPRFPTVRGPCPLAPSVADSAGIRRRGLTIEALRQYMLAQGPSQAVTSLEWDAIWATNKKIIDPVAPRHTAVVTEASVKVTVQGAPEAFTRLVPRHKKNLELGEKTTAYAPALLMEQEDAASLAEGEEFTLMDWGNAVVRSKAIDAAGVVTAMSVELNLAGDVKKTKLKATWLAAHAESPALTTCLLLDYDYLSTKKKLDEGDDWVDFINPVTEFATVALADANVASLEEGAIIQFERKGYYRVDKPAGVASKREDAADGSMRVELVAIPDGRLASVALKAVAPAPAAASAKPPLMYEMQPVGTADAIVYRADTMYSMAQA